MPSQPPLSTGEIYHIFNRGNNRETIFRETRNYPFFLQLYTKHISPIADTYAYCLLPNHFHLLVYLNTEDELDSKHKMKNNIRSQRTVKSPSQSFGNPFNAYTKAINKTYARTGSLFENPFHRRLVKTTSDLLGIVRYES